MTTSVIWGCSSDSSWLSKLGRLPIVLERILLLFCRQGQQAHLKLLQLILMWEVMWGMYLLLCNSAEVPADLIKITRGVFHDQVKTFTYMHTIRPYFYIRFLQDYTLNHSKQAPQLYLKILYPRANMVPLHHSFKPSVQFKTWSTIVQQSSMPFIKTWQPCGVTWTNRVLQLI